MVGVDSRIDIGMTDVDRDASERIAAFLRLRVERGDERPALDRGDSLQSFFVGKIAPRRHLLPFLPSKGAGICRANDKV